MAMMMTDTGIVQLYSITDVARAAGIPVATMQARVSTYQIVPAPTIPMGKRRYYDQVTFTSLVAQMREPMRK